MKISLVLVTFSYCVFAYNRFSCHKESALVLLKQPTYKFSMHLLARVTEDTDANFVFSPLTTWFQIVALSEGATGETLEEISRLTNYRRNRCLRKRVNDIISRLQTALKYESKRKSLMAIDKAMSVKTRFVLGVQNLYEISVLLLNFKKPMKAASEVNNAIEMGTGGLIDRILYDDDFAREGILMNEANFFNSVWLTEFYPGYTETKPFYSNTGTILGSVSMMHQIGYFNMIEYSKIGAKILEMPLGSPGISMLLFLPADKIWIGEIFYALQKTQLSTIFTMFKQEDIKLVNVRIPKFNQLTEVENLPELLYDMGIRTIFNPKFAELKGISNHNVHISLMTQISHISMTEKGVSVGEEFVALNETSEYFNANRPFAYIVVDKTIEFILYAGAYSIPSKV